MLRSAEAYDEWATANLVIQTYGSTAGSGYGVDSGASSGSIYFDASYEETIPWADARWWLAEEERERPRCAYCGCIYPEGHGFDRPNCSQCGAPKTQGDER